MTTRRAMPFFLTSTGRKISFAVVTSTAIAISSSKFALHSFGISFYKDFVQYYEGGKPVEVSQQLQDRFQKCLNLLKIPDVYQKSITPFAVSGFDLFHAGAAGSKFGVLVGIPKNFTYQSFEDVKKDNIQVNLKNVVYSTEVGKQLADSIVLPEKVQEFALCREILMGNTYQTTIESTYPFACIFSAHAFTQYVNHRLNLYAAPTIIRGCLYTLVTLFATGLYFLIKDSTEIYYETRVDKALCELGTEYIESGVIFYDKLLKRNQALRQLMGNEGENKYSKLGNELYILRQPRISLMHRKQFFEEKLKEKLNKSEVLVDTDSKSGLNVGQLNV